MSFICVTCIGDEPLRQLLKPKLARAKCTYCGKKRVPGVSIENLASIVQEPLRSYVCLGEEWTISDDSDRTSYERQGSYLEELLQAELEIDEPAAQALVEALVALEPNDPRGGDVPFFTSDEKYHRCHIDSGPIGALWKDFAARIKHDARFFNPDLQTLLAEILGAPGSQEVAALPVFDLGPSKRIEQLYRARRLDSEKAAREVLGEPSTKLSAPPAELATPGRMNPQGVAMFYGALAQKTALAVVRPYVGSFVVVGEFTCLRALRLFDLSRPRWWDR